MVKWQETHNYQQLNWKPNKKKKEKRNKNTLIKQLEQEQNHRNGDHMEGYQWGGTEGRMGEKVQRLRSFIGRHKTDKGRLGII